MLKQCAILLKQPQSGTGDYPPGKIRVRSSRSLWPRCSDYVGPVCSRDPQGNGNDARRPPRRRGVIPPPFAPVVRRLSTVPGCQGLVDFEESMIIYKLREVERSDRSAAWFEFDPLLCSQRATGAAPVSVTGDGSRDALSLSVPLGTAVNASPRREARGNQRGRLKDC